jgi:hypothetical protein
VEKRNHYWLLDCVLALTAIALGIAALFSLLGLDVPPQSAIALGMEALLCAVALGAGVLFAGLLWRDRRQTPLRKQIRAHQERHALMLRRESQRTAEIFAAAPPVSAPAVEGEPIPETLLVTSLTDVKAGRSVERRQQARRTAEAAVATAA